MLSNPTADFKSIELRLLAHLSEDPVLIDILNSQQSCDVFTLLASEWCAECSYLEWIITTAVL